MTHGINEATSTPDSFAGRIYYEDQSNWKPADFYALFRYLNRLFLYIGPTPAMLDMPASYPARIQTKRTGKRDDELAALDLSQMTQETRYLMKHLLIAQKRYQLALTRFPNLSELSNVGELGHDLVLDEQPDRVNTYLLSHGIIL